jgi:hypothetical protein
MKLKMLVGLVAVGMAVAGIGCQGDSAGRASDNPGAMHSATGTGSAGGGGSAGGVGAAVGGGR